LVFFFLLAKPSLQVLSFQLFAPRLFRACPCCHPTCCSPHPTSSDNPRRADAGTKGPRGLREGEPREASRGPSSLGPAEEVVGDVDPDEPQIHPSAPSSTHPIPLHHPPSSHHALKTTTALHLAFIIHIFLEISLRLESKSHSLNHPRKH